MQVFHASVATDEQQLFSGALKLAKGMAGKGMLLDELKVRAALRDAPHLPQVLAWAADDAGTGVEGILYEAYPGTLQQHIEDQRKRRSDLGLPAPMAADPLFQHTATHRIIRDLLQLLSHAHGAGVYHCDLKPSNLLIGSDGRVAPCDWGLSRIRSGEAGLDFVEGPYGTDRYMPHELRKCERVPLNASLDTFPLAMIVVELILGLPPRTVRKLNNAGRLARQLPDDVSALISSALSADRAARPSLRDWINTWPVGAGERVPEPLLAATPAACAGSSSGSETVTDSDARDDACTNSADMMSEEAPNLCVDLGGQAACAPSRCAAESNRSWQCQPCGASDGLPRRTRSACCGASTFDSEEMEPVSDSFVSEAAGDHSLDDCVGEAGSAKCAPRRTRSACCGASTFNSEDMEPVSDSFVSEAAGSRPQDECVEEAGSAQCAPRRSRSAGCPASLPSTPATSAVGSRVPSATAPCGLSPAPSLSEVTVLQLHPPPLSAPPLATASKPCAPPPPLMWQPQSFSRTASDRLSLLRSMDTVETLRLDTESDVSSALTSSPVRCVSTFNSLYMPSGVPSPEPSPRRKPSLAPRRHSARTPEEAPPRPVSTDGRATAARASAGPAAELRSDMDAVEYLVEDVEGRRVSRIAEVEEEALEAALWRTATPAALSETFAPPAAAILGPARPRLPGKWRRRVLSVFAGCFSCAACRVKD